MRIEILPDRKRSDNELDSPPDPDNCIDVCSNCSENFKSGRRLDETDTNGWEYWKTFRDDQRIGSTNVPHPHDPYGSPDTQEERFRQALARLPERPKLLHAENSAAVARRHRSAWDCVRPGIFLYGVGSGEGALVDPEPVVHVRARIIDLRRVRNGETVSYDATYRAVGDRRIATLGIGYADGYPRALSNRGCAILGGRRVSVAGLVTMDMTMVDATDVPCALGDVATVIGNDPAPDVAAVARAAEMSPYELLTGLRGRLSRVYRSEGVRA